MSASSSPTLRPRSRKPSARLSAVVDLPTPPFPDATAMIAPTPGISACRDIGEPPGGCVGWRWADTGFTPPAGRGGGGALPVLRSAVSAIIAAVTPGMARTALSASARTLSQARASCASTLIEKNTLPSLTVISDSTFASLRATPRGDLTLESASRTCCCVTLTAHLLLAHPHGEEPDSKWSHDTEHFIQSSSCPALGRASTSLFHHARKTWMAGQS